MQPVTHPMCDVVKAESTIKSLVHHRLLLKKEKDRNIRKLHKQLSNWRCYIKTISEGWL